MHELFMRCCVEDEYHAAKVRALPEPQQPPVPPSLGRPFELGGANLVALFAEAEGLMVGVKSNLVQHDASSSTFAVLIGCT